MLSWLGLDDCYWHMIEYLPLNQITKLILRSSYHELSAFGRFDEACLRQRGDSVPEVPILLKFLSNCSSLKELHLIDPNEASLRALVTVYPENPNNSSGLFLVCSSLDLLRIEIPRKTFPSKLDYRSLTDRKHDIVAPRRIETVELEFYQREDEGLWPALSELNRTRKTVFVNEHEPL
ncbi:hypothetical protein C8R42DRAFT_716374 [Lentinula raphanica]|nr:hypothetical protein C8R42DRAFT_716374 [Lentinula raphanica]